MLMSVFLQTHDNWLILIRDDMSTDGTVEKIKEVCLHNGIASRVRSKEGDAKRGHGKLPYMVEDCKVVVDVNDEKFWEVKNVLSMIRDDLVREDDIICRLDGDDFLCNLCALQDINVAYEQSGAECLWTAHRWADTWQNISQALPDGADVYKHPWVTSHLKTFRKSLITGVSDENFRGPDGEYIKRAGDQAIYLPVLHNAHIRVFLPTVTYYYTIDMSPETFQTDDAKFQKEEAEFLRNRGYVS